MKLLIEFQFKNLNPSMHHCDRTSPFTCAPFISTLRHNTHEINKFAQVYNKYTHAHTHTRQRGVKNLTQADLHI